MKRRDFVLLPANCLGGILIYTLAGVPIRLNAQDGTVRLPLQFFTTREAQITAAACERIFPSDHNGPGAKEAGVVIYIDRQLAGPYRRDRYRYTKGPFVESTPEHGYQGKDNPQTIYRNGLGQLGEDFADLDVAHQDDRLRTIEKTMFFRLLRSHTIEGMFSDPLHGGNASLIGWQLIGYPGPVMSYRNEIDKFYGQAYRRTPMSLEQIVGHAVKGWEEERD